MERFQIDHVSEMAEHVSPVSLEERNGPQPHHV